MRLINKLLFAILMLFIIFLSGCNQQNAEVVEYDYRTGTEGIELSFLQNAPPNKIYTGDEFNAIIELKNKGAPLNPTNIYVTLSGPSVVTNIPVEQSLSIRLEGKSALLPDGGYGTISFESNYVDVPSPNADYYKTNLQATTCYTYTTLASENVCIDPNPYRTVRTKQACIPQEHISVSGGQGGPIGVTNIEEHLSLDRVNFVITVKDLGNGAVFDSYALESCRWGNLDYRELNKVGFQVDLGGDFGGVCYPSDGLVTLSNGEGIISCTFYFYRNANRFAYGDQLSVELDYGYTTSISKPLEIVNILG